MALQMSWQQSLLLKRRKTGAPLGLKNIGNTCYLNSVLQCLTYTPPLANFCFNNQHSSLCDSSSEKRDCPFCILEKRIVRSLTHDAPSDVPSKIHSSLRIFSEHFRCGRQEDAHEFLRYVLDACHNTCLRLKKLQQQQQRRKGNDPCQPARTVVQEIFGGALQSQVKCLSCGAESNKTDEIMDISLDLLQSNSLKDAMQRFFRSEVLDGSNKYKCEKCKKLVAANKQLSILQSPNILVIQLKRFEGIHGGKIDRAIAFEEFLVLSSYLSKANQDPHPEYNLFGTIVHSGYSPESGHYYAYIKDAMGRWYCCNDAHVSLSTLQEVLSEKVYILFFSRTNQRPRPTKPACASNGVKSPDSNGNDASAIAKPALPSKTVSSKPYGSETDVPTLYKNGKVPSGPQIKFGNFRSLDSKRVHVNGNGNIHKNGHVEKHGGLKEAMGMDKIKKEFPSITHRGEANENSSPNLVDRESKQTFSLPHGNGEIKSVGVKSMKMEVCKNNGTGNTVATGRWPESDHSLHNEGDKCPSKIPGSKRKSVDNESCNLLAKDAYRTTIEEFKEALAKDASSSLRSCDWHEKVYSFMCARKRLCAQEAGSTINKIELKNLLIAEAKRTFITQIPESLKEQLIERLRSFSQGKQFLHA